MKKAIIADLFVIPVMAGVGWVIYCTAIDNKVPSILHYQHERFLSREVRSVEAARFAEVEEARTGQTVWRYLEYTLSRPVLGEIHRKWVCRGAQPVTEPVRATVGEVGDHSISVSLTVPYVADYPADCEWRQTIRYKLNTLTTVDVEYPSIKLRILPP